MGVYKTDKEKEEEEEGYKGQWISEVNLGDKEGNVFINRTINSIYQGHNLVFSSFSRIWRGKNIWKNKSIWKH